MNIWIIAILGVYFLQTLIAPTLRYTTSGTKGIWIAMGNRDNSPEMPALGARFDRALINLQEALFVFLPLAILAKFQGEPPLALNGAMVFVIARVAYVPAYISGVPGLRSLVWMIGHAGIGMVLVAVINAV